MKTLIDISYYQDPEKIDYDLLLSHVDGVIIRLGYGVGTKDWVGKPDPAFERHYAECKARGIPVGCYHFMVEYKSVNEQLAIVKQALDGKHFELGFWADVELEGGAPALTRATVIEYLTKAQDYVYGIYTGAWCWNPIMGSDNPYSHLPLWVGSYTSSGRLEGYAGNLDMNRCTDETWEAWTGATVIDEIEPLEVPLFSQKDVRWAGDKLGTSAVTIGAYGCLLTDTAMLCKYFGKDTDPGKLNQDLITVNGYEQDNLLRYSAITTIYPDIVVDWHYFLTDVDDALVDEVLMQEVPAIVQVDYHPDTTVLEQHWVLIIGKDQHGYIIADPIDGEIAYLSRYGNRAFRMVVYYYEPTEQVLFKAKCIADALNVRSGPSTAFDKVDLLNKGDVVNVYEVENNWFRIGDGSWCSGYPQYMEKIETEPQPPELTLEERVSLLEERVTILEETMY
jgi:GH25 family lysozyme M1 (1,4-beta-N-acetylmuramidase)